MHKTLVAAAIAGSLALAPGLAAPARADHSDFFAGGGFRIGSALFSIVVGKPGYRHHGHPFYRSQHRLHYPGSACTDACFKEGSYYYHDPYCPVVLRHFDRHGANPYATWDRYAPRHSYDPRPQLHYRGRGHYDDRRYRGRGHNDRRYDRGRGHHRGGGRGHYHRGRYCPYDHDD